LDLANSLHEGFEEVGDDWKIEEEAPQIDASKVCVHAWLRLSQVALDAKPGLLARYFKVLDLTAQS